MRKNLPMILLLSITLIACILIALLGISPPSKPRQTLVLDELGCIAATRLGVEVVRLEKDKACELMTEMDFDFYWVRIGNLSINRTHVIASRDGP